MYPDFSYFLHDLFGTPVDNWTSVIKTFGFFLALAFLAAAYILHLELKRIAALGLLPQHETKDENKNLKMAYPHERVGDITIVAAISGLLGAKIFAIFESGDNIAYFIKNPLSFFTGSGLAMYGGLIGGFIGVFWFVRAKLKVNPIYVMDATAVCLIIAYGVGRIGCQMSGDGDWGIVSGPQPASWFLPDWLWSYNYPNNVHEEGIPIEGFQGRYNKVLENGVFPTPVYETIAAFLIGGFLWLIRKRLKIAGMLFMCYLILNGLERFFIEKIRVNDKLINTTGLQMTQAEIIAVSLITIGSLGALVLYLREKNKSKIA
jgi:phosphatidylglycerol---prolipoprotein diacylglyceryl transferase